MGILTFCRFGMVPIWSKIWHKDSAFQSRLRMTLMALTDCRLQAPGAWLTTWD
jgi:hypothetical protein